ncbi:MAG TPA: hypothetical protein VFH88_05430 [Candidatus Krumholzibacteria bacterium]|nr:hypothetical protein [Candidatus Krumholzibacteria bacterium]
MLKHKRVVMFGVASLLTIAPGVYAAGTQAKTSSTNKAESAAPDSTMHIDAGAEGKNFNSITIQGEDRVRVQFDKPELKLNVDPTKAPGLDWVSVNAVLGADSYNFVDPLLSRPVYERSPYAPRPWFDSFRDGPVASFRPAVSGVQQWSLEVADSRGKTVARFKGDGKPPKEITWDGTTIDGTPARSDLTYSYVLNAADKAGNKRSFVGDSFEIPPHLAQNKGDISMSFSVPLESVQQRVPEATVLEAATRLNETVAPAVPVRVNVTAPTFNAAKSIADEVVATLRPHLYGDASRIAITTQVDAGSADRASVTIGSGSSAPSPASTTSQTKK